MHTIKLNPNNLDAIIFDLNGTMIDDGAFHREAFRIFFERYHLNVSSEDYEKKVHAHRSSEIFPALFSTKLTDADIIKFTHEKEGLYRNLYAPHIKEVDGLSQFLSIAKGLGIKLAVASSSPPENVDFALDALGLKNSFRVIINGYEVESSKPDPEIYLRSVKALGTVPNRCLVFEDSKPGIQAAIAAKIRVVGVTTEYTAQELRKAGAESTVHNFREIAFL